MRVLSIKSQPRLVSAGLLLTVSLSAFSTVPAEQRPTPDQAKKLDSVRKARKEKLSLFREKYQLSRVSIDTTLNVPISVSGKLAKGLKKTDPVEAAYEFFDLNKEVFGLKEPNIELKVNRSNKDDVGTLVVFKQLYNGIGVWSSMIKVNFGRDGSLYNISGSPYPDIDISTTFLPHLPSIQARLSSLPEKISVLKQEGWCLVQPLCQFSPGKTNITLCGLPGSGYQILWVLGNIS